MKEFVWLNTEVIKAIHDRQIKEHGGSYGIRDENLLHSAIEAPQNSFHYESSTLITLAAKTVYSLVTNHPFVDGNKRTAYIAMRLFLQFNNHDIAASPKEKIELMIKIASSEHSLESVEMWLREHIVDYEDYH